MRHLWAAATCLLLVVQAAPGVTWLHPAGLVTDETVAEVRAKLKDHAWARQTYATRKTALDRWLKVPSEQLVAVFPKKRGNVYHDFSCPADRRRLEFDPFNVAEFKCRVCGKIYPPQTDAGIYPPGNRYHGTMYDGWACLFYMEAGSIAADMGLAARIENDLAYARRGIEILMAYADTIERLPTRPDADPQMRVILTYHREGDGEVLYDLACAYELLRGSMTPEQRGRFEKVTLRRMLDDVVLEPIYRYEHNNLYAWHRTVVQTALCLEREDLIDWAFGYGEFDRTHKPEHRSIARLAATHFKPDGAYWEMCSGYHLYPLSYFCELAVISRGLVEMDPQRFPAGKYDLTSAATAGGQTIGKALHWFMSVAMPDRSMPTIGDSMNPRAGMDDYYNTAEVGYRWFDLLEVGDYATLQQGTRSWAGLLYGAPQIRRHELPATSSMLSSGWVSLRNRWKGNDVWVGLNALIPGGGHQHADRLGLVTYSHGQLLALEKCTPYNHAVTSHLARSSPSHNTVTVDSTSQTPGSSLTPQQTPKVTWFYSGEIAAVAELRADHLYPQTSVYRRKVALIEDVVVDAFEVRGGKTHDWILHHAGSSPDLSFTMEPGSFTPAAWLANGSGHVRQARTDAGWYARWRVADVTSRLTMAGSPETEVYAIETFPFDNAVITPQNPPCQSLCVRRHSDAPFVAVWDAWKGEPNLRAAETGGTGAVRLKTASSEYHVLMAPGQHRFADGMTLSTDASCTIIRNRDAILLVGGSRLQVGVNGKLLRLTLDAPATVSAQWADGIATVTTAATIQYDTWGGDDYYRAAPRVAATVEGDLWSVREVRTRSLQTRPACSQ